jgi:hypothetical protein
LCFSNQIWLRGAFPFSLLSFSLLYPLRVHHRSPAPPLSSPAASLAGEGWGRRPAPPCSQ